MLIRDKASYVDAVQWLGDANYHDVCAFVGISPQHAGADRRRIFLPGPYEQEATPGDWILRSAMVGDCHCQSPDDFARSYDQAGVSAAGIADVPFARKGVARYHERSDLIAGIQWLGDTNYAEVCAFVGRPDALAATDRSCLRLPQSNPYKDAITVVPGQWILRWSMTSFLNVSTTFVLDHYEPVEPAESLVRGVA